MANEVKELVRQIAGWPGWRVEESSKGFVVYPPDKDKTPVTIHRTESDRRASPTPSRACANAEPPCDGVVGDGVLGLRARS